MGGNEGSVPSVCHGGRDCREEGREGEQSEHSSHHTVRRWQHNLQLQVDLLFLVLLHHDVLWRWHHATHGLNGRDEHDEQDDVKHGLDADGVLFIEDVFIISFVLLLLLVLLLFDDEQWYVLHARGGSGGMSLPPMRGMEMPGFPSMPGMTIEEMPSAASTPAPAASETPYTVTSPVSPRTHKVGAGADYTAPSAADSDTSVLLQYKEGSDYKLALNMQQYSPDDITIKLNGRTLTIEAAGHGEQFQQKHVIPDNIDLDAMSSSFSSDGVLVIKAPKMK